MLSAALPLPSPVAPVAVAPADATAAPDTAPCAFARELQQARGDDGQGAEAAAGPASAPEAARTAREAAQRGLRREAAGGPSARGGAGPAEEARDSETDAVNADGSGAADRADPQALETTAPPDASLLPAWLMPLRPPAAVPTGPGGPPVRTGTPDARAVDAAAPLGHDPIAGGPALASTTTQPGPSNGASPAGHTDRGLAHALAGRATGTEPQPAEALTGRARPAPGNAMAPERDPTAPVSAAQAPVRSPEAAPAPSAGFAMELQRATQALAPDAPAAPPRDLQLPTPVASPEFVPRLSAEVAVLARDGVQEARLQLNPAELGPVAVRIVLDGDRAQVHLAVDHTTTLQLLDQNLPTLAAALRDQGLTLSGGGVFQQPRQAPRDEPGTQAQAPWQRGRGEPGSEAAEAPTLRRVSHRGGLDVYA